MDVMCYTPHYIPLHHYPWCLGLRPRPCCISHQLNIYFCLIFRLNCQKYQPAPTALSRVQMTLKWIRNVLQYSTVTVFGHLVILYCKKNLLDKVATLAFPVPYLTILPFFSVHSLQLLKYWQEFMWFSPCDWVIMKCSFANSFLC